MQQANVSRHIETFDRPAPEFCFLQILNHFNFEYSIFTEGNGCSSTLNFSIIVTPNTMDKPEAESVQSFCIYDAPKIKDIVVYANNLKWYSADGLSILDPETPLVDGETYYAHNEIIVSESSSIDRYACRSYPTTIQVFVQDTPPPQILEPSNRFSSHLHK